MESISLARALYAFLHDLVLRNKKSKVDGDQVVRYLRDLLELPVTIDGEKYSLGSYPLHIERFGEKSTITKVDLVSALYNFAFGDDIRVYAEAAARYHSRNGIGLYIAAFQKRLHEYEG